MDSFVELRQAVRSLVRTPQASLVVIFTLALGLAATTLVFSVFDAIWLAPLPLRGSDRLVVVAEEGGVEEGGGRMTASGFLALREDRGRPAEVAAAAPRQVVIETPAGLDLIPAASVTRDFFQVLGVEAALGRTFAPEDAAGPGVGAVVVDQELWRTQLGGDREAAGRTIRLGSEPHTVLGVLPARMPALAGGARIWMLAEGTVPVPGGFLDSLETLRATGAADSLRYLHVVGRLANGLSHEQAAVTAAGWSRRSWPGAERELSLVPLRRHLAGEGLPAVLQVLAAAGLLLLATCADVATILLARALGRRRELAVRVLLGAPRRRILLQVVLECWLLALAGGTLALAACWWAAGLAARMLPPDLPRLGAIGVNPRVVAAAFLVAIVTGTLAAVAPAVGLARDHGRRAGAVALPRASEAVPGRGDRSGGAGRWLVLAQVALAVVLACGAALVARSLTNLLRIDPGFAADRLAVLRGGGALPGTSWTSAEIEEAARALGRMPGVTSVATGSDVPAEGGAPRLPVVAEGATDASAVIAGWHVVSPGYFRTVGIPLLEGRACAATDTPASPPVAMVSREAARRLRLGDRPLGRRVRLETTAGADPWWVEVAGVVGDARFADVRLAPEPEIFYCTGQNPASRQALLVRTAGRPDLLLGELRAALVFALPHHPVRAVQDVAELVAAQQATVRLSAGVFGVFAATAVILAAIGLYGVLAVTVARRRHELAVRVALGATRAGVVRLAVAPALQITLAGLAVGSVAALSLQRYLRALLFGVAGLDPWTLAEVALLFLSVAFLASVPAAWRALRTEASTSLKEA